MKARQILYSIFAVGVIVPFAMFKNNYEVAQASNNQVTNHEIKKGTYYGEKAMLYYGFKKAGGVWKTNRKLDGIIQFAKGGWTPWQAGIMGDTSFKVKGKYVHFGQSSIVNQHKKDLVVKISTVSKYVNRHGGKSMLKSLRKIGTEHQLMILTKNDTDNNIK